MSAYQPGELVLLGSNLPHCWKNQPLEGTLAKSTVIQWNERVFPNLPELAAVQRLLRSAERGLLFKSQDTRPLLPQILILPDLRDAELYLDLLSLLSLLAALPLKTLSSTAFKNSPPDEDGRRLALVHELIDRRYAEKLTLAELAGSTNLTEQGFSRFFSKLMGRPFFSYLNEYRTKVASRLLLETDRSVAEIAYDCGYDSLPFFYRQFKKYQLSSPTQFRKSHLTANHPS